jgi:hypothetical protein
VFGRRDGLHHVDSDGPSGRGPTFFVCGAPAPLRAPTRRPPRSPDRDRASTSRTHARGSRTAPNECPLGGRTRPVVPQPGSFLVDAHPPIPRFVRTEPLTACAVGVLPSPRRPAGPVVHPLVCLSRAAVPVVPPCQLCRRVSRAQRVVACVSAVAARLLCRAARHRKARRWGPSGGRGQSRPGMPRGRYPLGDGGLCCRPTGPVAIGDGANDIEALTWAARRDRPRFSGCPLGRRRRHRHDRRGWRGSRPRLVVAGFLADTIARLCAKSCILRQRSED